MLHKGIEIHQQHLESMFFFILICYLEYCVVAAW